MTQAESSSCHGCGTVLLPTETGRPRKWCSERCRKAQYSTPCIDCGAPTGGSNGRGPTASSRCRPCDTARLAAERIEAAALYREDIERLWAEGKKAREIAVLMGWTTANPGALISGMRRRGYNLPYRLPGSAKWHRAHPESIQHARAAR